jgi:hypothetical protein
MNALKADLEESKSNLENKEKMVKRLKDMYQESKTSNKDKETQANQSMDILNKRYRDLINEHKQLKEAHESHKA